MSESDPTYVGDNATGPADNPPVPPQVGSAAISEQPDNQGGKRKCPRWLHKVPNWIEAISGIALVIITWTYTHYAGGQLSQMQESGRQTKQMLCLIQQQIAAANRSAGAAEIANSQARDSARLDQRPWVYVFKTTIPEEPQINRKFIITMWALNNGKTPALDVKAGSRPTASWPQPADPVFDPKQSRFHGLMPPGGGIANAHFDLPPEP